MIGALSEHLKASYGVEALRYAAMAATGFYLVAAALMLLATRTIERDWERD